MPIIPHLSREDLPDSALTKLALYGVTVEEIDIFLRRHGSDGYSWVPDDALAAAWVHDFLYRTKRVPKDIADELLEEIMLAYADLEDRWMWRKLKRIKARIYRLGVRCFGRSAYDFTLP